MLLLSVCVCILCFTLCLKWYCSCLCICTCIIYICLSAWRREKQSWKRAKDSKREGLYSNVSCDIVAYILVWCIGIGWSHGHMGTVPSPLQCFDMCSIRFNTSTHWIPMSVYLGFSVHNFKLLRDNDWASYYLWGVRGWCLYSYIYIYRHRKLLLTWWIISIVGWLLWVIKREVLYFLL